MSVCVCVCVCVKRANICIVISLQSVSHMQDSGEVEEEIQAIPLRAPSILMTETSEATTYDIIVEGASLAQSTDLNTALIDLFSAYFVFDIAYPLAIVPILIFFQHYVFGLKDRQKIPVSVATTVGTMRRLD